VVGGIVMVGKRSVGEKIFDCSNVIVLILLSIVTLYPFLYIVFASLSDASKLISHSGILWHPLGASFEAYKAVFENKMIYTGYINTLIYVFAGTALNLFMTAIGAYVLSRKGFYWRNAIMVMIVITMFFGGGLIPSYLWMKTLHLYNNRLVLIIPGAIATTNLIIMMTYFKAIPSSLEESAGIDGANHITILFRIILPLSMPVVAVMILYYGVAHWNSWFGAMIYLKDKTKWPLQLVLREILIQNAGNDMTIGAGDDTRAQIAETIKYATIIVATVPILCIYPFLQKYFAKGVLIGAIKE
jgi:putative aldouronate transport system permease protein